MKNLRTIAILVSLLVFSIACKKNNQTKDSYTKTSVENKQVPKKEIPTPEISSKAEVLKTFGEFDTKNDKLDLNVPVHVSKDLFTIREIKNISSPDINAIIIRVNDDSRNSTVGKPVNDTVNKKVSLSAYKLNLAELRTDKKLKVITLHSTDGLTRDEIDILKDCIGGLSKYDEESCTDQIRLIENKDDEEIPNSKKGSIVIGI